MADVFISYAREDALAVEKLAARLDAAGISCWWDKQLTTGTRYLDKTGAELAAARVVLVVWTRHSIVSHWVADEAGEGRDTGRLAAISLDGSIPPLGFRQFQSMDFSGWKGGADGPMADLVSQVAAFAPQAEMRPAAAPPNPKASRTPLFAALGLLLAALLAWGGWSVLAPGPSVENPLLAVLPFDAVEPGPDAAKFAESVAGELHHTLAASGPDLRLIARSSSFTFKGDGKKLAEIQAQLKPTHILDGRVSRTADKITIDVELTQAGSGRPLFSVRIEDGVELLDYTLNSVSRRVRSALDLAAGREQKGRRIDPDALDLYYRLPAARSYASPATIEEIVRNLTRAVEIEPDFARAWQDLASWSLMLSIMAEDPGDRKAAVERAQHAAQRALELAPDDPQSWFVASDVDINREHPEYLARGIELQPNGPQALESEQTMLRMRGRAKEARAVLDRLIEIDPKSSSAPNAAFYAAMIAGDIAGAEAMAQKMVNPEPLGLVAVAMIKTGDLEGATRLATIFEKKAKLLSPAVGGADPGLARLHEAREVIAALRGSAQERKALADRFAQRVETDIIRNIVLLGYTYGFDLPMLEVLAGPDRAYASWFKRLDSLPPDTPDDPMRTRIEMAPLNGYGFLPGFAGLQRDPRFFTVYARYMDVPMIRDWVGGKSWPPDFCKQPGFPYDCTQVMQAAVAAEKARRAAAPARAGETATR